MTAAGDHDVDATHESGEVLVALERVELVHHHDLVHARGAQGIHGALHIGGGFLEVAGGGIGVVFRTRTIRRGLGQEIPGGGAHDADLLPGDRLHGIGSQTGADIRHFIAAEGGGGRAAHAGIRLAAQRAVGT